MSLDGFFERNRISSVDWEKANISFDILSEIYDDYSNQLPNLNESAEFLAKVLQKSRYVHSVRWRVKDPDHVLEKIVRKRAAGSEKYMEISVENYHELITDLVGVRVLHLFKHEWMDIHKYIKRSWEPAEAVVAYIREGDEGSVVDSYRENDCRVEIHPVGYRSIHYIISTQPTLRKVLSEIQVRTIFEEGWSEIDHRVRYPNFIDNKLVSYFLTIFNRMAGSADEMGAFVNNLVSDLRWKELQNDLQRKEQEEHLIKIEELAKELSKEKDENKNKDVKLEKLKNEIERMRESTIRFPALSISGSALAEMEKLSSVSRDFLKISDLAKMNKDQMDAIKLSDLPAFSSAYEDILKNRIPDKWFAEKIPHTFNLKIGDKDDEK